MIVSYLSVKYMKLKIYIILKFVFWHILIPMIVSNVYIQNLNKGQISNEINWNKSKRLTGRLKDRKTDKVTLRYSIEIILFRYCQPFSSSCYGTFSSLWPSASDSTSCCTTTSRTQSLKVTSLGGSYDLDSLHSPPPPLCLTPC